MRKILLLILTLFILPSVSAGIHNITISTDTYVCSPVRDGICPSDYGGCQGCINDAGNAVDDHDCCSSSCEGWWCTDAGVVCGDSTNEHTADELNSLGETYTECALDISCTEHTIDDTNQPACVDDYTNMSTTDPTYAYTDNCADDGILFRPYTATGNVCVEDVSCRNADSEMAEDNGDMEICDSGTWHDPDESSEYCTAAGGDWLYGSGTDTFYDDYDGDLAEYCDGDDGYIVTGAVLGETYRGSEYCEALTDVTITIKDATSLAIVYTTTTSLDSSWLYETLTCHEDSTSNAVGRYDVTLEPGSYYLVAEKSGYNTVTRSLTVGTADQTVASFWMYYNAECQSDCTMNDKTCHAECAGVNGCTYATYETESVANYCNGLREGYRYVLSETEGEDSMTGYEVSCCTGEPTYYGREYFTADDIETSCVENIISKKKVVTVNGEVLNLHFVLFSDPQPEKTGCAEYADFSCSVYGDAFC